MGNQVIVYSPMQNGFTVNVVDVSTIIQSSVSDEDFQWGNGNPIDPSMWLFQTRASAFIARLRKNEGVVGLDDTTSYQDSKYYVCETEPGDMSYFIFHGRNKI